VIAQFTAEGTNDLPLGSLKPTGRKMSLAFCEICPFDKDGLMVSGGCYARARESFDQLRHRWDYDEHTPLDVKRKGLQVRDGIHVFDITYASPVTNRAALVGPNGGISPPPN
jgi:hypothetical protein